MSLSAPIGGTLMIAGRRVNVIAADESSITYTAAMPCRFPAAR